MVSPRRPRQSQRASLARQPQISTLLLSTQFSQHHPLIPQGDPKAQPLTQGRPHTRPFLATSSKRLLCPSRPFAGVWQGVTI